MRFSLGHIFPAIALVAIALSMRASWISFENDDFIPLTTVTIAIFSGAYAGWFRPRLIVLLLASFGAAIAASAAFSLERVFHSPDAMFPRTRIATYYFDSPQMNLIQSTLNSAIATVAGTLSGYWVSRFHDWLTDNAISLGVITATSLVFGFTGFHFGTFAFPYVPPARMSFFSGMIGIIFGVAWVSSYGTFPVSANDRRDAE